VEEDPHDDDTKNQAQHSSTESLESAVVSIPEVLPTTKSTDVVDTATDAVGTSSLKESA